MTTSENVVLVANLRMFLFHENQFCSSDIQFSIFKTNASSSKVAKSWWVLAHEVKYISECLFWIMHHLFLKLGQLMDVVKSTIKSFEIFMKSFEWFGGLKKT